MSARPSDHKRVSHFDDDRHLHELTFSTYQQKPLLSDDHHCTLLAESVDRAMSRHRYCLTAFVFMPDHVHLLVYPLPGASPISDLLFAIKRPCSHRVRQRSAFRDRALLHALTVRQRPGITSFRFWQEGPGYDRNIMSQAAACAAIDYLHLNPVRRGLVAAAADWKWSSARFYLVDPPTQEVGLPGLQSIPADWLS